MVARPDYRADAVAAARSVLLEVWRILGEYRDQIVLVGGWVPELLFPDAEPKHIGSLDIDLALDHRAIGDAAYATINDLLTGRGYVRDDESSFTYQRTVRIGTQDIVVEVDLLAGEYEGTGRSNRRQAVQDVRPRKARGCDLAFDSFDTIDFPGRLPNGAEDRTRIRVAGIVPFLIMKGMALAGRLKEKDAYDIYFCIKNFPGGVDALASEFGGLAGHGLVKEGIANIAEKFSATNAYGPQSVADFEGVQDTEAREMLVRDAYEQVFALIEKVRELGSAQSG